MNAKQAKQIPLEEILHRLGYQPIEENREELLYSSPFRQEKSASFFLNTAKNVWHDFGHGKGGNVVDFIMIYYQITSVSTALKQLDELLGFNRENIGPRVPRLAIEAKESHASQPKILKIQPLQNKVLIEYLQTRGIKRQTASAYVKEIYDSIKKGNEEKSDFALAFPNLSGGYEVRNPYFKGSLGKKDISLLAKRKRSEGKEDSQLAVTVFEGFMDFLSALSFYQVAEAKTSVIVLNSVSFKQRAVHKMREHPWKKVYLYLDQDEGGNQVLAHFIKQLGHSHLLQDNSDLYTGLP